MSAEFAILIERRTGECGCPEEQYLYAGLDLIIHFEPNGDVDGFIDGGDWGEAETSLLGLAADAGRLAIFTWAARLTGLDEAPA